jgi:transposase, IS6 family
MVVIEPQTGVVSMPDLFKGRHFPADLILWAVRWYCRYPLSYRHLEEMSKERGLAMDHSTVARWVQEYGPELEKKLRSCASFVSTSWRVDETSIRVNGEIAWLYRAVDKEGNTVDFRLSPKQDKKAARQFFRKALSKASNPRPEKITTDGHLAYPAALKGLKKSKKLAKKTLHRTSKYLNNRIESDHARLKQVTKPMWGFKRFHTAQNTLAGMEALLMLRKRQFKDMKNYPNEVAFVHSLFGLTA